MTSEWILLKSMHGKPDARLLRRWPKENQVQASPHLDDSDVIMCMYAAHSSSQHRRQTTGR